MRVKTVGELKELLEEFDDDIKIMAVHQPSWPLRETIGGLWLDDGSDPEDEEKETCGNCGRLSLESPKIVANTWVRKCFYCEEENPCEPPMSDEDKVVYIVLDGHPYEGSPYGNKKAWSAI